MQSREDSGSSSIRSLIMRAFRRGFLYHFCSTEYALSRMFGSLSSIFREAVNYETVCAYNFGQFLSNDLR